MSAGPSAPVVQPVPQIETTRSNETGRFGPRLFSYVKRIVGTPSQRRLARGALAIDRIRHFEKEISRLSDVELKQHSQHLRGRARGGESLDRLLPEVYAALCVAAWRALKIRPYDVQLAAGVVLHYGALAEVATGEGKTLIATFPAALNALVGKGTHVTTVNDYLANRDAEWTAAIYNALGISVGCLAQKMTDEARLQAYRYDITYGTASEFGFDFLRDRLKQKTGGNQATPFWAAWSGGASETPPDPRVQREHYFALVDEADNIFVDEARTPLIISGPTRPATEPETVVYRWSDHLAKSMANGEHFRLDEKHLKVELTELGRQLIRYSNPPVGAHSHAMDKLHEHVERAIQAHHRFRRDQHYMVDEDKIVIIDEFTGRRMPDRHWREGLHQAVEAKEQVPISLASDHAAQITYQSYFRLYEKLTGMSGTAAQNFWELRRVYKLWVVPVPTNKPPRRKYLADRVFGDEEAKFRAIAEEVKRLSEKGRAILIGTRSVDKSEKLSQHLDAVSIRHQVLNAKPDKTDREAEIIAQAGRRGSVTIATNMAGRGTDILLGGNAETLAWMKLKDNYAHRHEVPKDLWERVIEEIEAQEKIREQRKEVAAAGGLHVIGTERHEAKRIDRQLIGRAARQGDPGSCQFFLSLEDELLEAYGPARQEKLRELGARKADTNLDKYLPIFFRAQRRMERRHFRQRVDLMMYEKQRQEILKDLGADPYVD